MGKSQNLSAFVCGGASYSRVGRGTSLPYGSFLHASFYGTVCDFMLSLANTTSTGTNQGIIKLFVTSWKESDIQRAFQQNSIPTIEVEAAKVNSDIELYVKAQIELRLQNGSLKLKNIVLEDKIFNTLTTKAGGMYVFFELFYYCKRDR